ncbi:MAG: hypothetical protein QG639_280 [Patescibacteria group bacterium]|nr:hypothetical protein [Patescibacteria group bacterium]
MFKWMKNWIQQSKSNATVIKAGEASIAQYRELYEKLDAYDKGEIAKTEVLSRSRDLRRIIQSS